MSKYNWGKFIQATKSRKPTVFLIEALKALKNKKGWALDLGCGAGIDAKYMAENGFQVEAIDLVKESIEQTKKICKNLSVFAIQTNITDFKIKPKKYLIIVCRNTLPFLTKKEAEKILGNIQKGLRKRGVFIFGLFGPEDDWAKSHPEMSFWTVEELKKLLPDMEFIKIIEERETGSAASGEVKFWHKIQGIARKK